MDDETRMLLLVSILTVVGVWVATAGFWQFVNKVSDKWQIRKRRREQEKMWKKDGWVDPSPEVHRSIPRKGIDR